MRLFSRLFSRGQASEPSSVVVPVTVHGVEGTKSAVTITSEIGPLHKVAGTTTFCRVDAQQVAGPLLRDNDGYLVDIARVERIPADAERPEALDVTVLGYRIGALPSYVTSRVDLQYGQVFVAPVQLCAAETEKGPRLDAWVWLGDGHPRWSYSRYRRPPVTAKERSRESNNDIRQMVREGLSEGGQRRKDLQAGTVNGIHYLETAEPIKQLKREGQLDAALRLCYIGIEGAEGDRRFAPPPPFYTLQAAIIHRKLKQRDEEIAVLQRWLARCPADQREQTEIYQRLHKLTQP